MVEKSPKNPPKNGRPKNRTRSESERVDFLVWTDVVSQVPPEIAADKVGMSIRSLNDRRARLKAFVDPTGELLKQGFQSAVSLLAVEAFNTLMYHIKKNKDKDLAIRILENVEALKRVNTDQPAAGVTFQQWFTGLGQVPDADRNRIRSGLTTAFAETNG